MTGLSEVRGINGVTDYTGLSSFYFKYLLQAIINIGGLRRKGIRILDFGCGYGQLKRLLGGQSVVGFDLISELSDVEEWRGEDFDVLVANQVFYSFSEEELRALMRELKDSRPNLELVVGVSRQGFLNRIGMLFTGRTKAHSEARLTFDREIEILREFCTVTKSKNVLFLARVFSMKFR